MANSFGSVVPALGSLNGGGFAFKTGDMSFVPNDLPANFATIQGYDKAGRAFFNTPSFGQAVGTDRMTGKRGQGMNEFMVVYQASLSLLFFSFQTRSMDQFGLCFYSLSIS